MKAIYKMTSCNLRWAFNASAWKPNLDQMLAISQYIQPEEKERIARFVFQDDAKSSLIGRLLMRKFAHNATAIPYDKIRFARDDKGKPYLLDVEKTSVDFNVSHQGDYVVLAGNTESNIGVDVMKIEPPVNKNIPEFFRLMNRQFSNHEWLKIRSFPTEMEQIACFYRFWCLKESYVKNIGVGITIPLANISFNIKTDMLKLNKVTTDTVLYENDVLMKDWIFEESLIDDKYTVAVSLKINEDKGHIPIPFTVLTFEDLVKEAKPVFEVDQTFSNDFMKKEIKNF